MSWRDLPLDEMRTRARRQGWYGLADSERVVHWALHNADTDPVVRVCAGTALEHEALRLERLRRVARRMPGHE